MTDIPYRESLSYSERFGYPVIAKQALLKMGVISLYDTPDNDMLNLVYDTILDITLETINSNLLGEFRTRRVKANETYYARPFDHVLKENCGETQSSSIELPIHFRDAMGTLQYSKNLDVIKITDTKSCSIMYLMFDGTIKKWCNVNEPIFNVDSVPLSNIDRSGYIDYLILRLAPYFGVNESSIGEAIAAGANRWKSEIISRNIGSRDGEKSYLFGTTNDEYYNERSPNIIPDYQRFGGFGTYGDW